MSPDNKSRPACNKAAYNKRTSFHSTKHNKSQCLNRDLLPLPQAYYATEGIILMGKGEWKDAICPFHPDTRPSLRINITSGGFKCMACGTKGGDIISFHMQRHGLRFINAVKALGGKV
jgi:hypothetical protein